MVLRVDRFAPLLRAEASSTLSSLDLHEAQPRENPLHVRQASQLWCCSPSGLGLYVMDPFACIHSRMFNSTPGLALIDPQLYNHRCLQTLFSYTLESKLTSLRLTVSSNRGVPPPHLGKTTGLLFHEAEGLLAVGALTSEQSKWKVDENKQAQCALWGEGKAGHLGL